MTSQTRFNGVEFDLQNRRGRSGSGTYRKCTKSLLDHDRQHKLRNINTVARFVHIKHGLLHNAPSEPQIASLAEGSKHILTGNVTSRLIVADK